MPIFTNKYKYLGPLEFFENENFDVNEAQARRKFGFVLLKFYTPPYCKVYITYFYYPAAFKNSSAIAHFYFSWCTDETE